jgi:hypothetical protein
MIHQTFHVACSQVFPHAVKASRKAEVTISDCHISLSGPLIHEAGHVQQWYTVLSQYDGTKLYISRSTLVVSQSADAS